MPDIRTKHARLADWLAGLTPADLPKRVYLGTGHNGQECWLNIPNNVHEAQV